MADGKIVIKRTLPNTTTIQNSIIWDGNISPMARFTLIAMLSMREGWDYSVRGMAVMLGISKDTMSKYMRELERGGYLKRIQDHESEGRFAKAVYVISDTPMAPEQAEADAGGEGAAEEGPCPNFSDTAAPCPNLSAPVTSAPVKSPQQIYGIKEQNGIDNNTPLPPKGDKRGRKRKEPRFAPEWKPERFAGLWEFYPQKGRKNKQAAMDAWDKLRPDDELIAKIGRALVALKATDDWQRGVGIPYVATFLNGARWEDAAELDQAEAPAAPQHRRVIEREALPVW